MSTNKSLKSSKREARRQSQKRNQMIRTIATTALAVAAVVVAGLIVSSRSTQVVESIDGVQSFPDPERGHTTDPIAYDQAPPVGGVHNPAWLNCGVYSEPVQNENAVHSLEHGAIWIAYQPEVAATEVQQLEAITRLSGYRLLSPYPNLPSPIVLSAWGYQLQLEQAGDPRLMNFVEKYERHPEGPEPGAPCTGGIGEPG